MEVQALTRIFSRAVGAVVSGVDTGTTTTETNETTQSGNTTPTTTEQSTETGSSDDFSTYLTANLKAASDGTVSEEDLFAGIVKQRMFKLKGEEGAKKFDESLAIAKREYRSVEEATKYALMRLQESQYITYEEGHKLHAEAFEAAQLDGNKEMLYDGTGGANDPTKAVEAIEKAILSAKTIIEKFDDGSNKALERPVAVSDTGIENVGTGGGSATNGGTTTGGTVTGTATTSSLKAGTIAPNGTVFDGSGGFLFKPLSENERKLAVLSPDGVGPMIKSVKMLDAEGNLIEEGRFTSFGDDGRTRAKYAFRKDGGSYPKNVVIQMTYVDGTVQNYSIPDPSKRYD